MPSTANISA